MNHIIKPLSVVIVLALTGVARATPVSGSLSFGTSVHIFGNGSAADTETAGWTGTPTTLLQGANAVDFDENHSESRAFANGESLWDSSGNSGSLRLTFGWDVLNASAINTNDATPDWSYTFIADDSGTFQMHYSIFGQGDQQFGLNGFTVSSDLIDATGAPITDVNDPTTFGEFSGGVIAGDTYTVSISNDGNLSSADPYDGSGMATGVFIWSVSNSVPDQGSTLIMFGAAVAGLVGLQARKPKLGTE